MDYDKATLACNALGRMFGFEPKKLQQMLKECGGPQEVLEYVRDRPALVPDYVPAPHAAMEAAARELDGLERCGACYVGICSDSYPSALKDCPDAPAGLYLKGRSRPEDIFGIPAVAFVGTRDMSSYGRDWCARLVRAIAGSGGKVSIVSGLALGIDSVAHRTALDCGLPTIAVMATGIDDVYPYRNTDMAGEIAAAHESALVTDFPSGTSPLGMNFLRRNRIIAGLSGATVLVESRIKGGGMMTARLAWSYERDVLALPGRAEDVRSQGCNYLIHKKISEIIPDIPSFLDLLGMKPSRKGRKKDAGTVSAEGKSALMNAIISMVAGNRDITPEEIARRMNLPYHEVNAAVGILEAEGILQTDLLRRCSLC